MKHLETQYCVMNLGDRIKVIVITGGPCSGKTTGLARLNRMLSDRGYKVITSPESATKLIGAGMRPGELPWIEFQEEILLDTLAQEQRMLSIASRYREMGNKVVVLCDRGTLDGEAYLGAASFANMITALGYTYQDLCSERYHAVIHLQTAAQGAEAFYTLENNKARTESIEVARMIDESTLYTWMRHPHPRKIDNSTDFEGKLRRLFSEICGVLGDPVPLEKEDKFLIEYINPSKIPVKCYESFIVQDYLVSPVPEEERRIRARNEGGNTSYYYTVKRQIEVGVRSEEERMITKREYTMLKTLCDPASSTIMKRRICFFWKEQFFEVDLFVEPRPGLVLMEAERTDRTPVLDLPPFINVLRNVTDEMQYSNAAIAKFAHKK